MQSGPTIHTAAHVGVRTYISPTHTQQVMSLIDTAVGKNQSSGKNPAEPSGANDSIYLFDNDIKPDPTENNHPSQKNPTDLSDINDSIDLFGNDIELDPAEKNQRSEKKSYDPSDVNDSIDLFGNDVEPDPAEKISHLEEIPATPLMSMIQLTSLVTISNLITT
jgi:hypothetical protein